MTEWLIRQLSPSCEMAVLSRGYRRKTEGFRKVKPTDLVEDCGDEPLQMALKFPGITVAVDANRVRGIERLEQELSPDFIVLDDGYQHRKVVPKYTILLTSYGRLYSDDWYLPTGDLRDHRREASRANAIVVTKCPPDLEEAEKSHIIARLKPRRGQMVLFASLKYAADLRGPESSLEFKALSEKKFILVTGIANPVPLVEHLKSQGLDFEHKAFPDHHPFTPSEIAKLRKKDLIVTTEKDYMRLKGELSNLYYLEVAHEFMGSDADRLMKLFGKL